MADSGEKPRVVRLGVLTGNGLCLTAEGVAKIAFRKLGAAADMGGAALAAATGLDRLSPGQVPDLMAAETPAETLSGTPIEPEI